jgi:hypothetical protein
MHVRIPDTYIQSTSTCRQYDKPSSSHMLQRAEQPLSFLHLPVLPPRARPTLALCSAMYPTRVCCPKSPSPWPLSWRWRVSPRSPQPLTRDPLSSHIPCTSRHTVYRYGTRLAFIQPSFTPKRAILRGSGVSVNPTCMVARLVLLFFVGAGECVMVHKKHNTLLDCIKK